ncbi:hypothetical protein [Pontiella sulfatireligans]|uniref:Uncharacterized protein n=1 Tax=Pontiella sulfatireligans TaxID=2750658 RepID=A0A6C2UU29_9BACT|nr:hypothetical protein [Pontiella sulfatireligans]VGO22821.1 hypothetical protein SCARR_04918 [Pontiella sulfatireligans]
MKKLISTLLATGLFMILLNGCMAAKVAKVPVKAGKKAAGGAVKAVK